MYVSYYLPLQTFPPHSTATIPHSLSLSVRRFVVQFVVVCSGLRALRGSRHRRLRNYLVVHGSDGADKSYFNADPCNQRPLSYCSVPSLHLSREHIAVFQRRKLPTRPTGVEIGLAPRRFRAQIIRLSRISRGTDCFWIAATSHRSLHRRARGIGVIVRPVARSYLLVRLARCQTFYYYFSS